MSLNPPISNKPGLAAWRRGFWDQRKDRTPYVYRARARWLQVHYQRGWYEAEHNPDEWSEACFSEEMLMMLAFRFSLDHAITFEESTGLNRVAMLEAIMPGWQRLLDRTKAKQKEPSR